MAHLARRQSSSVTPVERVEPVDPFGTIERTFDEMFGFWPLVGLRRPMAAARQWLGEPMLHVDEFRQDGTWVIRAELPGIDPEKDVELTVTDGVLHIDAHREAEKTVEERDYVHREMSYGAYHRDLPLPAGATESDVTASYRDGILEIRVPEPEGETAKRIPVSRS